MVYAMPEVCCLFAVVSDVVETFAPSILDEQSAAWGDARFGHGTHYPTMEDIQRGMVSSGTPLQGNQLAIRVNGPYSDDRHMESARVWGHRDKGDMAAPAAIIYLSSGAGVIAETDIFWRVQT